MKANGKIDFTERLNHLYDILRADGTQRLYIGIHPTKPLVYEVYSEDGIAPSKRWHDEMMIGTFTLKLKEPDPVKRVIRHQRRNNATKSLMISLKYNLFKENLELQPVKKRNRPRGRSVSIGLLYFQ